LFAAGLLFLKLFGFSSGLTQTALLFGVLLTGLSSWFLAGQPLKDQLSPDEKPKGYIASKVDWIASVQSDIFDIKKAVEQTAINTGKIAVSSDKIVNNTDILVQQGVTKESLMRALQYDDKAQAQRICAAGVKYSSLLSLVPSMHNMNWEKMETVKWLKDMSCLDQETICADPYREEMLVSAVPERVELVCGTKIGEKFSAMKKEHRDNIERERQSAYQKKLDSNEASYQKCVKDFKDTTMCSSMNYPRRSRH
jgi:hypothetical protein